MSKINKFLTFLIVSSSICTVASASTIKDAAAHNISTYNDSNVEYHKVTKHFTHNGTPICNEPVIYKNNIYYTSSDGTPITGWHKADGSWYYFGEEGKLKKGLFKDPTINQVYYTNDNGELATGWVNTPIGWMYFNEDGSILKGWKKFDNHWYYLEPTTYEGINVGVMAIGWKEYNNRWYYFYSDGKMAANAYIGSYFVNGQGAWVK